MDNYLDVMRTRREQILERFYAALDRAGRPHDGARLIAVSKTVGVNETIAAIQVGYRHFAENRPQELVRKLTGLAEHPELPEVRFDMIGNLQTDISASRMNHHPHIGSSRIFLNFYKVITTTQRTYLLQAGFVLILHNRHFFKIKSLGKQFFILLFILMVESQRNNFTNL